MGALPETSQWWATGTVTAQAKLECSAAGFSGSWMLTAITLSTVPEWDRTWLSHSAELLATNRWSANGRSQFAGCHNLGATTQIFSSPRRADWGNECRGDGQRKQVKALQWYCGAGISVHHCDQGDSQ